MKAISATTASLSLRVSRRTTKLFRCGLLTSVADITSPAIAQTTPRTFNLCQIESVTVTARQTALVAMSAPAATCEKSSKRPGRKLRLTVGLALGSFKIPELRIRALAIAGLVGGLVAGPATAQTGDQSGCASAKEFFATDCPLSFYGITLFGTYDIGVGWVSHGLPENGTNLEGESLINRNGNHSQWLIAPDNLSQSTLGIRGKEEFMPGW